MFDESESAGDLCGVPVRALPPVKSDEFGLRGEPGVEKSSQADGFVAGIEADQRIATGGCVAFVEDQIDYAGDTVDAEREIFTEGKAIGDASSEDLGLGADDALDDRGFGQKEGAGNFSGG